MQQTRGPIIFTILMILASHAAAVTSKCIDAHGKVIYTNTECPSGYQTKSVSENITVIDGSAERALIAQEIERSKTPAASVDNNGNELSVSDPAKEGLAAASLANLKDAESLIQTTVSAREKLWLAITIFIGIAVLFLFFSRRKKRPSSKIHREIVNVIEQNEQ